MPRRPALFLRPLYRAVSGVVNPGRTFGKTRLIPKALVSGASLSKLNVPIFRFHSSSRQPLTAPAVTPSMMYFWNTQDEQLRNDQNDAARGHHRVVRAERSLEICSGQGNRPHVRAVEHDARQREVVPAGEEREDDRRRNDRLCNRHNNTKQQLPGVAAVDDRRFLQRIGCS